MQGARDDAFPLYCPIQHVFTLYCCRARCIGFALHWRRRAMDARQFDDMPEDLRGCCARALDTSSAGCFGRVNKACQQLVEVRLAAEKAAHEARYEEFYERFSSRCGEALTDMCRVPHGPKLITLPDGGATLFKCVCVEKELKVGRNFTNLACHLATRRHWQHRRLVAFGEAQPTEAEWLAFKATLPAAFAPM
jgi:hypothetical protein